MAGLTRLLPSLAVTIALLADHGSFPALSAYTGGKVAGFATMGTFAPSLFYHLVFLP